MMWEKYTPGLFIGIVLVMGLYNFFLFFSTRDKNYFYYVMYILGAGLIFIVNDGALDALGSSPFWNWLLGGTIFDTFFFVWLVLFTQSFLETKRYARFWHYVLFSLLIVSVVTLVVGWLGWLEVAVMADIITGLTGFVVIIATAVVCLLSGNRAARFFLAAQIFLAVGTVLFILTHIAHLLPPSSLSPYYMKLGMTFEVVLASIGLADRINLLKAENALSQQKMIAQLVENEKLKDKVNRELEEKVRERTSELAEKNKNILDSIHYAKRIQQALLPGHKFFQRSLERVKKNK